MKFQPITALALSILPFLHAPIEGATLAWFGNSFSGAGLVYDQVATMVNCNTCGVAENLTLAETLFITPSCMLDCQATQGAFAAIDNGHFDYVVAQDNTASFMTWNRIYQDGSMMAGLAGQFSSWATHAKNAGGKLVIEEMWLNTGAPEQTQHWQDVADQWYDSVTHATGSMLAPCGHAWWTAEQKKPDLEYTDPNWNDGRHPGTFGAYLNACCFYATLTGVSPVGHTNHSVTFDNGSATFLPDSLALFAQQEAWAAYQYFNSSTKTTLQPCRLIPATNAHAFAFRALKNQVAVSSGSRQMGGMAALFDLRGVLLSRAKLVGR